MMPMSHLKERIFVVLWFVKIYQASYSSPVTPNEQKNKAVKYIDFYS